MQLEHILAAPEKKTPMFDETRLWEEVV